MQSYLEMIMKKIVILVLIVFISLLTAEEEHYTQNIFRKDINVVYQLTNENECIEVKIKNNIEDNNLKFTNLNECLKNVSND